MLKNIGIADENMPIVMATFLLFFTAWQFERWASKKENNDLFHPWKQAEHWRSCPIQGLLKIWTEHSKNFLLFLQLDSLRDERQKKSNTICFIRETELNIEGVVLYKDVSRYGQNTWCWPFQQRGDLLTIIMLCQLKDERQKKRRMNCFIHESKLNIEGIVIYKDFLTFGRSTPWNCKK